MVTVGVRANEQSDDDTMTSASKKQKTINEDVEWKITFDQTQGLRTMIDVICNILTRVNLRITYDEKKDLYFLCIDSIDPQHVCMIQARLCCEKTSNIKEDIQFCVDSVILNNCLKSVPSHYSLDLYKEKTSADVVMCAYETLSNSHSLSFELNTLIDESETMQLTDMDYKYTIEIDLSTLRQIVKMSMTLRAGNIEFVVKEPTIQDKVKHSVFTIAAKGDASITHNFYSATVQEDDTASGCVIKAATDSTSTIAQGSKLKSVYGDAFSAQYLNYFLKSMERQMITMKLSQDKPLILHYPLGAEKSYICFVLAPKTTD